MQEVKCAKTDCQWCHKGKCVLFVGVTGLECKYRIVKPTKPTKKGK